jgi:hypothetical protein
MRRSFFDIYLLTIGAPKIYCAIGRDMLAIGRAKSDAKTRMPTPLLRSVHGLTVEPPSLHVADKESHRRDRWRLAEVCKRSRKSASAQAGAASRLLTPECFRAGSAVRL